ncbi:MAG: hypothetical protein AB200_02485 [Parcubacteria bacterium C7867-005]|nr:MAG: hypothetical protein AB200_02485 [Parcubacteria bacterium C7867-005]
MEPNIEQTSHPVRTVLLILGLVVLALIVVFCFRYGFRYPKQDFSSEKVLVQNTDLATAEGENKLPAGFPKEIPVEINNITESVTLSYPERGATLYSVAYQSARGTSDLSNLYSKFIKDNNFILSNANDKLEKGETKMTFLSTKNNDDLSITITKLATGNTIQISFLDRQ